ncbi:MAG: sugar isomerase [Oscillospiraceae bacterium]|jgi:O-antigen/teichoic acid export membrane protein|nr:sugar isomerase [Oscillospiraceae bacterium]
MAVNKNKRTAYNIVISLLGQVIALGCGMLIPKLYIDTFGSEINGFISSVNQIFVYIALLEAGVGTATTQALYRPVAKENPRDINEILAATHRQYRRTGFLYLAAVAAFAAIYPLVVRSAIPWTTIVAVIALHGGGGVLTYFLQGKYRLLLQAEGKNYILSGVSTIVNVLVSLSKVVVVLFGGNIVHIQWVYLLIYAVQSAYFIIYIKRHYKWLDLQAKPNFAAISQSSSVMTQQIAQLIFHNTDTLLLTLVCGLEVASVYAVYNTFFEVVAVLIENVNNGFVFRLGQLYNTDKEGYKRSYDVYELFYTSASFAAYCILFIFIMPFMKLYTSGFDDAQSYLKPLLPLLFILVKIQVSGRAPAGFTINYAGHFKENRVPAIIEMIINLSVSLIAVYFWGIYGVLVGTIVALLYRSNQIIFYTNRKLLDRSPWKTYRTWLVNIALFAAVYFACNALNLQMGSYVQLLTRACMIAPPVVLLFLAVGALTNPRASCQVLQLLQTVRRKK